jgi:hypothetical protein
MPTNDTLLSFETCSAYGLAAATEQESGGKSTKGKPVSHLQKSGRPEATACGGKPNARYFSTSIAFST